MRNQIYLAAEDALGLEIGKKLITKCDQLFLFREENCRGSGNLKRKIANFKNMALGGLPVLAITDLDGKDCIIDFLEDWKATPPIKGFHLRVAVNEIESWILADRDGMARWLGLPISFIPSQPDSILQPKEELLRIVSRCKNRILRNELLPKPNSSALIGVGYNRILSEFINEVWDLEEAVESSPSLKMAWKRLLEFDEALRVHEQ